MSRVLKSMCYNDSHTVIFGSLKNRNEVAIAGDHDSRGDVARERKCQKVDRQLDVDSLLLKDRLTGRPVDPAKLEPPEPYFEV